MNHSDIKHYWPEGIEAKLESFREPLHPEAPDLAIVHDLRRDYVDDVSACLSTMRQFQTRIQEMDDKAAYFCEMALGHLTALQVYSRDAEDIEALLEQVDDYSRMAEGNIRRALRRLKTEGPKKPGDSQGANT